MSEPRFVEIERVTKRYEAADGQPPALDGVSLEIDEGEFVALMGPSGSGKSTLLTALGAMNRPTEGRVRVDGIDVYGLGEEKRADFRHEYLGFVFQQHHLLPYLTARENVELPLAVASLASREKRSRAADALARVGLEGKEHRLPSELSGGEQSRVAIARAIVNRPPLVLADEPTGNLVSATAASVMEALSELHAAGRTVRMRDGSIVADSAS